MKLTRVFLFLLQQFYCIHSASNVRPSSNTNTLSTTHTMVVNVSSDVNLTCGYSTSQMINVAWSRSKNKRYQLKKITVELTNVTYDDADVYTCRNSSNNVVISNTTLVVLGGPVWAPKPKYTKTIWAISDKDVVLPCRFRAVPRASAVWLKNGLTIKTNQAIVRGSYDSFNFKISEPNDYDSGTYTCRITNIYGQISRNFDVDVISRLNHAPIITTESVNKTVVVGDEARLYCRAKSDPEQMIRWYRRIADSSRKNGSDPIVTISDFEASGNPSLDEYLEVFTVEQVTNDLVIPNFRASDSGEFLCLASNPKGSDYRSFWLNALELQNSPMALEGAPKAKNDFSNVMILIGIISAIILILLLGLFYILLQRRRLCCVRIKKRIIIMKENESYVPHAESLHEERCLLPPKVTIEHTRFKLTTRTNSFDSYEIPLDKNWEVPRENVVLGRLLGEGAFGKVVKAKVFGLYAKNLNITVAVKMLKTGSKEEELSGLIQEMELMKLIGKHNNILSLLGCCTQKGPLYVITEFAMHGNLRDFLRNNRPTSQKFYENDPRPVCTPPNCSTLDSVFDFDNLEVGGVAIVAGGVPTTRVGVTPGSVGGNGGKVELSFVDLVSFGRQIARGMQFLAAKMCVHRDLAARNILISEGYVVKIADFGLTRSLPNSHDYYKKLTDGRLPVKWMSPEALFDRKCNQKSDIWSYGILLWEIFSMGGNPYPSIPVENLFDLLRAGYRMECPPYATPEIYELMMTCWSDQQESRPTFGQVVQVLDMYLTTISNKDYLEFTSVRRHCSADSQYSSLSNSSVRSCSV